MNSTEPIKTYTYNYINVVSGFLLNCGGNEKIQQDSLTYGPDDRFIKTGNKSEIKQEGLVPLLSSVRHFPADAEEKFCYNFPVNKGKKLIIKTIYYYGGFDGGTEPPIFDQIIDGTKWNINTSADYADGLSSYYEVIMVAQNKVLSICLARNEHTTSDPFISAIEVLYLDDSLYNTTDFGKYALVTLARHSFGSHDKLTYVCLFFFTSSISFFGRSKVCVHSILPDPTCGITLGLLLSLYSSLNVFRHGHIN